MCNGNGQDEHDWQNVASPRGKRKGLVTRGTDLAGHFRIGETLAENMRKHTLKPLPLERESALLVEVSSRSMAPLT